MNFKPKLIFSLLAFLSLFSANVCAKEFFVTNITELRGALKEANGNAEDDVVNLSPGIYEVEGVPGEDGGDTGDLDIQSNISLFGASPRNTILQGNGSDRILHIRNGANVILKNLQFTKGIISDEAGGAILIEDSSGNFTNFFIQGNSSLPNGGGGGMRIKNSILSLSNCLISGNETDGNGGGLLSNIESTIEIKNCTITGNTAGGTGGGIQFSSGNGLILNSTITLNSSNDGGEGIEVSGGTLTMGNTIVAKNSSPPNETEDFREFFTSLGGNIIGNNGQLKSIKFLTVIDQMPSDQIGFADDPIDPMLGPLQNNGGPTDTYAILPGSPALNAGEDSQCLDEDQRGVVRPLGGQCDIGAFEVGCGDGTKEDNETCDDGNNLDGDGCSSICKLESTGGGGNNNNATSAGGCGQLNPAPTKGLNLGMVLLAIWVGFLAISRKKRIS